MDFIVEYWAVLVGIIAVLAVAGVAVYVFFKMPTDKQLDQVREWLLYAVTIAEKELGEGTGQIKLRFVYDMFIAKFGIVAKVMPFAVFSALVDEALEKMRHLLETNENVANIVNKK